MSNEVDWENESDFRMKYLIGFLIGCYVSYKYDLKELHDLFRILENIQ